jgi:hypothetical protein
MLKLYCEVVSGDTTVLDMDVLVPVGYHERTPVKVGPEDIVMTVDGKEVEIRVAADDDPNLEPGTLYVRENFPAGSQMCIKASVEGADPIEAKTVMPLHLDDYRLEMQLTDIVSGSYNGDNVRDMVRARLILPEVAEGTHVGIQYVVRHKTDSCGVMLFDEQVLQAVYDVTEFSSDGNLVTGVDFSNLTRLGATLTYVWNATDEYEFLFRHLTDSVSEWKDENGETVTWSSDYHFKFRIFALSEEYYQYHSRTTNKLLSSEWLLLHTLTRMCTVAQACLGPYPWRKLRGWMMICSVLTELQARRRSDEEDIVHIHSGPPALGRTCRAGQDAEISDGADS